MKILKKFLGIYLLTVAVTFAQTTGSSSTDGSETGNGGDGVIRGETILLLDFVEAGESVAEGPYFAVRNKFPMGLSNLRKNPIDPEFLNLLRAVFISSPEIPVELVTLKLTEIAAVDRGFALALLYTMQSYTWRVVGESLFNIQDEGTPIQIEGERQVQLAVRRGRGIYINRNFLQRMTDEHKVGLIYHEAIYALIKPRAVGTHFVQESLLARQVNGYMFSPEFVARGGDAFRSLLGEWFPHVGRTHTASAGAGLIAFSPTLRMPIIHGTNGRVISLFQFSPPNDVDTFRAQAISSCQTFIRETFEQVRLGIGLTNRIMELRISEYLDAQGAPHSYVAFNERTERQTGTDTVADWWNSVSRSDIADEAACREWLNGQYSLIEQHISQYFRLPLAD